MEDTSTHTNCLNCDVTLTPDTQYCPQCGQAIKEARLSIWQIIGDAFSSFFNLDSRIFHTLRDLYAPSKLTSTYVAGKRKFYMNPVRMFIFSLIALIALVQSDLNLNNAQLFADNIKEDVVIAQQKQEWDTLMVKYRTPENEAVLSALSDSIYGDINIDDMYVNVGNIKSPFFDTEDFENIKKKDLVNLSSDELNEKYELKGWGNKLFVRQYQKMALNPSGSISYVIQNLSWVVLFLIFGLAAFMKLLYIRSGKYYVEHIVLLMYSHTLLFIAAILILLYISFSRPDIPNILFPVGFIGILVLQYLSLKKCYQQGWFKTVVKMFLINFAYVMIGSMIFLFGVLLSVIIL